MENSKFLIRFWGVRGSIPAPGPENVKYGGNTSCVEVRCGEQLIILDAGSGIRKLGIELDKEMSIDATILLSHFTGTTFKDSLFLSQDLNLTISFTYMPRGN